MIFFTASAVLVGSSLEEVLGCTVRPRHVLGPTPSGEVGQGFQEFRVVCPVCRPVRKTVINPEEKVSEVPGCGVKSDVPARQGSAPGLDQWLCDRSAGDQFSASANGVT